MIETEFAQASLPTQAEMTFQFRAKGSIDFF